MPGPWRRLPGGLVRTARPRQWVKNGLVSPRPSPPGGSCRRTRLIQLGIVFALFTACASAVYLINDARDAEADRAHPVKRHRPVAAGRFPVAGRLRRRARARRSSRPPPPPCCATPPTAGLLAAYLVMQLAYCVRLKHVLVVDLVVVTTGFLMRAMAGGFALGIDLSRWFLITSGFGALFMVAAKRYSELVLMSGAEGDGGRHARAAHRVHHRLSAVRLAARRRRRGPRVLPVGDGDRRGRLRCCPGGSCP